MQRLRSFDKEWLLFRVVKKVARTSAGEYMLSFSCVELERRDAIVDDIRAFSYEKSHHCDFLLSDDSRE